MNSQFIVVHEEGTPVVININNIAYIRCKWIYLTGVIEHNNSDRLTEMAIMCDESTDEIIELINKATGQNISLK